MLETSASLYTLYTVVDSTSNWIGFVGAKHDFNHTQYIDRVFLVWACISVFEQKVSQRHFEHNYADGEKYNKPKIAYLP